MCKSPHELGPGGTHVSILPTINTQDRTWIKLEILLACYSNLPVSSLKHGNRDETFQSQWMNVCFLLPIWICWVQSTSNPLHREDSLFYGWRKERLFLQHSPQYLLPVPISLIIIENHTFHQENGKQNTKVNVVFSNQKLYAFMFEYALNCKFLHLIFGVPRTHSSMS